MSRFKGWTTAAVLKLTGEAPQLPAKKNVKLPSVDYPGMITEALRQMGITVQREYRFCKDRRFRFDLAIPAHMIAIEFEGGTTTNGGHTRAKGYEKDAKKYNLAMMHGWRLLRYTTLTTTKLNWEYAAALEIKNLIEVGSK